MAQLDAREAFDKVRELIQRTADGPHETAALKELQELYDSQPSVQKIVAQLTNIETLKGPTLTVVDEIQKAIMTPAPKLTPKASTPSPTPKPLSPEMDNIPGYAQFNASFSNLNDNYQNPRVKAYLNALIVSNFAPDVAKEIQQRLASGGQLNLLAATNLTPLLNRLARGVQNAIASKLDRAGDENALKLDRSGDENALREVNENLNEASRAGTTMRNFVSGSIREVVTEVEHTIPAMTSSNPIPITPKKT